MLYPDNSYIKAKDLSFVGVLHDIKKSRTALQPIFEAFTNALEAIKIKARSVKNFHGDIQIVIKAAENTDQTYDFSSITVIDNGIGFNKEEYSRFNVFKDISKNFNNLGSGRVQYVHYFDNTLIKSVFTENGEYYEREFILSKKKVFLDNNSIVYNKYCTKTEKQETGTSVSFNTLLENSPLYNSLTAIVLKDELLERYVQYFCYNKESLPAMNIKFYVQGELKEDVSIQGTDIPDIDKTDCVDLHYYKIAANGKGFDKLDKKETFTIDAFKIPSSTLGSNNLKLVSKGEIVDESNVKLNNLPKTEPIKGYRYLFLVSSDYINSRDTNLRGVLSIPTKESFKADLFNTEEIFVEDIQDAINGKVGTMYPEIETVKEEHDKSLDDLKEMFLLDNDVAQDIQISINDTDSEILEKFYRAESKRVANIDAAIKESFDNLDKLNPADPTHIEEFNAEVEKLAKAIPLQNHKSLTHYVARRKLLLDLFDKVINKQLDIQKDAQKCDESWVHNLLFVKKSDKPLDSDLWIINEDFIYFNGKSEAELKDLEINGKRVFKDEFSEEEQRQIMTLKNRLLKRPDVLLFPDEGKCIILEFKAPDVEISDHLNQINKYAGLIRNYTTEDFEVDTFYGYLLGENIDPIDVRFADPDYIHSYQFDFLFRPSKAVLGLNGKRDGSIYSEVIKYSTLLSRARQRNNVFIEKLR